MRLRMFLTSTSQRPLKATTKKQSAADILFCDAIVKKYKIKKALRFCKIKAPLPVIILTYKHIKINTKNIQKSVP